MPRAKFNAGGPQFRGSRSLPMIPAMPETSTWLAKYGRFSVTFRLKEYRTLAAIRAENRCTQASEPEIDFAFEVSVNPSRLGLSERKLVMVAAPERVSLPKRKPLTLT